MRRYLLFLTLILMALVLRAEDVTVKCHVVDAETGEALPYVAVYATEENGTLTNYEGDFTITADEAVVLRITCVGYESVSIRMGEAPDRIKMKPLEHSMRELEVRAWSSILQQVAKKQNKEYDSKKGKKSQYFMRMTTTLRTRDLVEAFVEANSAANLRDITILQGINGRLTDKGLSEPAIASMNFHHPLELGPLTRDVNFWNRLITPLSRNRSNMDIDLRVIRELMQSGKGFSNDKTLKLDDIVNFYDVTGEELVDENQKLIYRLHVKRNDKMVKTQPIMTGTLYVDAKSMRPLRFDGQVENLSIQVKKDLQILSAPIELSLHINYRHDKKFTEVSDIAIKMNSGDFQNQTLLYNVDDLKLELKANKKNRAKENMLSSIKEAGFDQSLWARANIIQRTREEERLAGLENQTEIAADTIAKPTTKMDKLIDRLRRFSQALPQEKVYLHMDNTNYFLGDTIWFAAYTRQTNNDRPSAISGVLYVELYNQDGYMMERKLVQMRDGRGHGNFALSKEYFGGFYELRAYTRWQLNWGQHEHWHSRVSKEWFLNEELEKRYFRDYDKIYSRVFPVYDAPRKEGQYEENMTFRPMRRYFKNDPHNRKAELTLYPEGGNLVAGLPCRVAYEALWDDGEACHTKTPITGEGISEVTTAQQGSRGSFVITPQKGMDRSITFTDENGKKVDAKLPKPLNSGASLKVTQTDDAWQIDVALTADIAPDSVGVTLMHEGSLIQVLAMQGSKQTFQIEKSKLAEGVNQVTVFDIEGKVLADRLFFNQQNPADDEKSHIDISLLDGEGNLKKNADLKQAGFGPYQAIRLDVQSTPNAVISMAVRDAAHSDQLYDNATMRTEMLLASEVKGFIPNPQWYFEKDDEEHRQALDLLLMIQGWRRFDWTDMAVPDHWELSQKAERTPIITGSVYLNPDWEFHDFDARDYAAITQNVGKDDVNNRTGLTYAAPIDWEGESWEEHVDNEVTADLAGQTASITDTPATSSVSSTSTTSAVDNFDYDQNKKPKKNRKNITVHAELASVDGMEVRTTEMVAKDGHFQITMPGYYEDAILFLSASDTTKWKNGRYIWIQSMPEYEDLPQGHRRRFQVDPPEYTVRVDFPYVRFVKPYNYYQTRLLETADPIMGPTLLADGTHQMREVRIGAKHSGMKNFSDSIPAFMIDAYQAYNETLDGGFYFPGPEMIVRNYVGDYGLESPFTSYSCGEELVRTSNIEVRFGLNGLRRTLEGLTLDEDSVFMRGGLASFKPFDLCGEPYVYLSNTEIERYYKRSYVDKYVIYTDYQPRLAGDERYYGSYLPNTQIAIYPYPDDSRRIIYRDRRYILKGFSYPDDFYHPNYKNRQLQDKPADYRRTLYWNPSLQIDKNGHTEVKFYNNGKNGQISISAEGMAKDGTILGN